MQWKCGLAVGANLGWLGDHAIPVIGNNQDNICDFQGKAPGDPQS